MTDLERAVASLKEMREACAAMMRVIEEHGADVGDDLEAELKAAGVRDGFGARCQKLIAELEGKP